jgi:2-polyprenyl-3-methyl-5-hydroxy-6-metoxy-1,4-benzoquinol methylase
VTTVTDVRAERVDEETDGTAGLDLARVEGFAVKVATDAAAAKAGALAYIGDRLGIWTALAAGDTTSAGLAERSGLTERYLREWLATQAAIGYVEYDPITDRFHLPAEHAAVLADEASPAFLASAFEVNVALYAAIDRVSAAFRTGDGIPWGEHDPRLYRGVDRFFRTLYERSLVAEWLPAVDGAVELLEAGTSVLDVGCGHGSAVVMLAQAFPASTFVGIDPHEGSVAVARAAAEAAGVADRVEFRVGTAEDEVGGDYGLVFYFDAFHHVGQPDAAARRARAALAPGGALVLVEPRAQDHLADNLDLVGVTYYGASAMVCVPDALAQGADDALGGQAGFTRLRSVLTSAGFEQVRLAAEADFNLVVEARA